MSLDFKLKISNEIVENLKGQCDDYNAQTKAAIDHNEKLKVEVQALEEANAELVKNAVERPCMEDAET